MQIREILGGIVIGLLKMLWHFLRAIVWPVIVFLVIQILKGFSWFILALREFGPYVIKIVLQALMRGLAELFARLWAALWTVEGAIALFCGFFWGWLGYNLYPDALYAFGFVLSIGIILSILKESGFDRGG